MDRAHASKQGAIRNYSGAVFSHSQRPNQQLTTMHTHHTIQQLIHAAQLPLVDSGNNKFIFAVKDHPRHATVEVQLECIVIYGFNARLIAWTAAFTMGTPERILVKAFS